MNYDKWKQDNDYNFFGWDIFSEEPEPDTSCECCGKLGFKDSMYWNKVDNTYFCNEGCFNAYWEE